MGDIPTAHTPNGGWHGEMPAPVLAGCDEPLVACAPDLRGLWEAYEIEVGGEIAADHPARGKRQRIEQCGDRLVVTASGIIHDMRCDGTEEHGVHDVAQIDYSTPIVVTASYENGVHVLRPKGIPITVTRRLDGDVMVWDYGGAFVARLERVNERDPRLPPGVDAGDTEIMWSSNGVPFVRTSDDRFANLPGFPFEPHYAKVDCLRMHYVDEGPRDGEVVLLLHGQPTWSYLYRKMIPTLVAAGHRVIAPDHIGMGRSDKPVRIEDYRYLRHVGWIEEFLTVLGLNDITIFVQDWGSLIGLRVVGDMPERFARIVVANGRLPVVPEGFKPVSLPEELEPRDDLTFPFADPAIRSRPWHERFAAWAGYALVGTRFRPSEVLANAAEVPLSADELAAYDAPFPTRVHMAGVRAFPSLVNTVGEAPTNMHASEVLNAFERPVLTLFGRRDEGMGTDAVQALIRDCVKGADGQPHHAYEDAGHFIQEDKGEDLGRRINDWMTATRRRSRS